MKEKINDWSRTVTLRQLRGFRTIVDTGSVSAAARAINLTPPAVSLQLKQLEAAAGIHLLEHGKDGMRVTAAGRVVLKAARKADRLLQTCGETLAELSGADTGKVAVGVVSTAKYFAPTVLAEYLRRHPDIEVQLLVGNRETTLAALRNLELDFAVTGRPPKKFPIESSVIGDHPHIIIARPDHPLMQRKRIALDKLHGERFLLRERGSGTRKLMKRLFERGGLSPTQGMEIGSNETIKQAVIAGLGIALISAHTVGAEIRDGRLAELPVKGLPVVRQWYVVRHRDKRLLPAAAALWDFFARSGSSFLP
jgi:LysR family transcriptional regulator, low CO2-responsive transcriptional regulator